MIITKRFTEREESYNQVVADIKNNSTETEFEKRIKEKIYRWWKDWQPDYDGWCKIADTLYLDDCVIEAIGDEPQIYNIYRDAMKHQRDAFEMDMGKIEKCVVEDDTLTIWYYMYLTAKADMGPLKKGITYRIKVTEFNTFTDLGANKDPMVNHLILIATSVGGH